MLQVSWRGETRDIVDDRLELELSAGSGGMGEVFRARDRASGTTVAVKLLLDGREAHGSGQRCLAAG